jgi:hypothetical protein
MKPISIREKLHTFMDVLPTAKLAEIYYLLMNNYRDEFKLALSQDITDEEMSDGEVDLMVQQLLG